MSSCQQSYVGARCLGPRPAIVGLRSTCELHCEQTADLNLSCHTRIHAQFYIFYTKTTGELKLNNRQSDHLALPSISQMTAGSQLSSPHTVTHMGTNLKPFPSDRQGTHPQQHQPTRTSAYSILSLCSIQHHTLLSLHAVHELKV